MPLRLLDPRPLCRLGACLLLAVAAGCATDKKVVAQANQFDTGLKPAEISQADLNAYFGAVGRRIVSAAKVADAQHYGPKSHFSGEDSWMFQNIEFHLVNSKTLNAFTTGGNHVYVYNELFQLCQNEEQLAAVMSHEFGHIYCRHVAKGMNRQVALMLGEGAVAGAGYAVGGSQNGSQYAQGGMSLAAAVGQFANMGFTRGDEAQADEVGFHFYTLAGWDPRHFGDFFQVMIDKGYDTTPAMASDHPTLASRVKIAKERAAKVSDAEIAKDRVPDIASPDQFHRYQQLAQQVAQNSPTDQTIANAKQLLQALPRSCWLPYEPEDQKQAQAALAEKVRQQEAQQPKAP